MSQREVLREALDLLVRRIVEEAHPLRIVLFGSAARGTAGPESDLDLLVVMPNGTHRRRTAQKLYGALHSGVPYDLLVVTPEDLEHHAGNPGLIYASALAEGRTLYAA